MLLASCAGSLESIKLLLAAGASPQRRSPGGRTAAQAARTAGHEACALSIERYEQSAASAHAAAGERQEAATRKLTEAAQSHSLATLEESIAKYGTAASAEALLSASSARDRLRRESTDSAEVALAKAHMSASAQLERPKPLNEADLVNTEASLVALRRAIAELADQPEATGTGAEARQIYGVVRLREARALRDTLVDEVAKGTKLKKLQQRQELREQKERAEARARQQKREEEEAAAEHHQHHHHHAGALPTMQARRM